MGGYWQRVADSLDWTLKRVRGDSDEEERSEACRHANCDAVRRRVIALANGEAATQPADAYGAASVFGLFAPSISRRRCGRARMAARVFPFVALRRSAWGVWLTVRQLTRVTFLPAHQCIVPAQEDTKTNGAARAESSRHPNNSKERDNRLC